MPKDLEKKRLRDIGQALEAALKKLFEEPGVAPEETEQDYKEYMGIEEIRVVISGLKHGTLKLEQAQASLKELKHWLQDTESGVAGTEEPGGEPLHNKLGETVVKALEKAMPTLERLAHSNGHQRH